MSRGGKKKSNLFTYEYDGLVLRWQTRNNRLKTQTEKNLRLEGIKGLQKIRGEVTQTHDKHTQKALNKEERLKGNASCVNKVKYMRGIKTEMGRDYTG